MLDFFHSLLQHCNEFITLFLVLPFIVLLGIYLTVRLRCIQVTKLFESVKLLFKKSDESDEGTISHYEAISNVLASNFGTGNIAGMAIALSTGGPGALVWMWVMTFFGAAIQFASTFLGVKYRKKTEAGEYVGGPMHYLAGGLGLKKVAALFAGVVIFVCFTAGTFVQINAMTLPITDLGVHPLIFGSIMAVIVGLVVMGGMVRIAKVCSAVVPIMAILYLGTAFYILAINASAILPSLVLVFKSAFALKGMVGGVFGYTIMKAITTGFDRAIFATDAGTGTVPLLQSGAKTKHPVIDGIITLVAPFLVMVVCTTTALVLMVTGAFSVEGLKSTAMVTYAFATGFGSVATYIVILSLILFGITTVFAWADCLQKAVTYLFGRKYVIYFIWLYILSVPVGAMMHVEMVWILADIALTSMLLINLIGVTGLSKEVVRDTAAFFKRSEVPSGIEEQGV